MESIVHVLSKNGTFLFRFNNGEFGSKWCGVWKANRKYFDYFAFKLGDEFLSEANFKEFSFYNSQFSVLTFKTKKGEVTESVKCYDDCILVSITPSYDTSINAEIGINIRDRNENYQKGKRYELYNIKNGIRANFNGASAFVYFLKGEFIKDEYYGVHSPGLYSLKNGITHYLDSGEVQNKYIPGYTSADIKTGETYDIILSSKELDFDTLYKLIKNKIKHAEEYGEIIKVDSRKFETNVIENSFVMDAIDSIYSYTNFNKKEIYAGLPYFNEFWLRDALIILPSFLSMGNNSFVKEFISKLAGEINERGLPNIMNGNLYPKDVLGLFLIDSFEYYQYTADKEIFDIILKNKEIILGTVNKWLDNGFIHDKGRETWMDSLDREYSIEIQAIWAKALNEMYKLYKDKEAEEISKLLKKSINSMFMGSYFKDQKDLDINSANQLFALYFDVIDSEKIPIIIKNLEENMLSESGVLSVSKNDKTFDFRSYQNGSIWPILTQIFAAVAFQNGRDDLGEKLISILKKNDGLQCSSRINEIIQPDGTPKGCPSQAWSICLIPFIIERHILGIKPDIPNGEVNVMKRANIKGKKTLKMGDNLIEIAIDNGSIKSNYSYTELSDRFILEI
jgi:hypothetical protein